MRKGWTVLAGLLVIACGCKSSSQYVRFSYENQPIRQGYSRVYVARPSSAAGGVGFEIFDNVLVGILGGDSKYLCWETPSGQHSIVAQFGYATMNNEQYARAGRKSTLTMILDPNREYYIKADFDWVLPNYATLLEAADKTTMLKCSKPNTLKSAPPIDVVTQSEMDLVQCIVNVGLRHGTSVTKPDNVSRVWNAFEKYPYNTYLSTTTGTRYNNEANGFYLEQVRVVRITSDSASRVLISAGVMPKKRWDGFYAIGVYIRKDSKSEECHLIEDERLLEPEIIDAR